MIQNDLLFLKADQLFKDAATIIVERGIISGVTYDPKTGSVDIYGAILLAAGAKPKQLCNGSVRPEDIGIPIYKHAQVEAAFGLLEELVGDVDNWNDQATTDSARKLLLRCCDLAKSEKRE
jgi:hypothetical protein